MKSIAWYITIYFHLLIILNSSAANVLGGYSEMEKVGQKYFGELKQRIVLSDPGFSKCYEEKLKVMTERCDLMSEDNKKRLAIDLYNCQRVEAGFSEIYCHKGMSVKDCLSSLGPESNAFMTIIFLHHQVQHICHFLSSKLWQERAENTIQLLGSEADRAVEILHDINAQNGFIEKQIQSMIKDQINIYQGQEKILSNHEKFQQSHESLNSSLFTMQRSANLFHDNLISNQEKLLSKHESVHKHLLSLQEDSKNYQEQMVESQIKLLMDLQRANDMTASLIQDNSKIFSMLSKISKLAEYTNFHINYGYKIAFYGCLTLVSYVFTSIFPQVSGIRNMLALLQLLCMCLDIWYGKSILQLFSLTASVLLIARSWLFFEDPEHRMLRTCLQAFQTMQSKPQINQPPIDNNQQLITNFFSKKHSMY